MFFLASGSAASGKTTLARLLPAQVTNLVCHDADEMVAIDTDTRVRQLELWVQQALAAQAEGADFLLTSHSPLGELLSCPSATQLAGIAACLLDCGDVARIGRMRARGIDPRWPPSQALLNWASWHRMHADDPQWEQHVILDSSPFPELHARWSAWRRGDPRWQVHVIDTTMLSVADSVRSVQAWIAAVRSRPTTLLIPAAQWWGGA
jgi:hypothetical protein